MKFLLTAFIALLIFGCSPSLYKPDVADAKLQESLLAGRKIYVSRCSNCHNLHLPKEFTSEIWKKQVDLMQVRAGISDDEKNLILNYLLYDKK
jgi:mono/diheme cytochrome c family protein